MRCRRAAGALRPILALVVVSALLTAFSESFYWYSGGTDYPARVLFYLIPTTALLWALSMPGARGWPGVVLAGAVYGFVTEGVLTPVLYGGFPFDPFAISYTSLGWHALVTVGFGLVCLHRLLARARVAVALAATALFGVFWGVWAMGLRLPPSADDELPALSALLGRVDIEVFAVYTVAVTALLALCHLLLGHVVSPRELAPGRTVAWVMLIAGGAWFAVLVVPAAPWAPVELAALLLLCRWGLARAPAPDARWEHDTRPIGELVCERIPPRRLAMLAALPVAATATYAALVTLSPADGTIRALCVETVVAVQTVAGWAALLWALAARANLFGSAGLRLGLRRSP